MKTEYRIRIEKDDSSETPREWDTLGTMVCWHSRYHLGDEQPEAGPMEWALSLAEEFEPGIEERIERFSERLWPRLNHLDLDTLIHNHARDVAAYQREKVGEILDRHIIRLPLYLMDHSGITMNTTGFSCPWDSGQVGWIYVTKADARKEYDWKLITQKRRDEVLEHLRAEVAVYAQYLEGDVYGFILEGRPEGGDDDDWEQEDSCWGFYGSDPFENGMTDYIDEQHHELLKEAA